MNVVKNSIEEHLKDVAILKTISKEIEIFGEKFVETLIKGNKILLMGNGRSAAERKGLPAIALTTDTSILTAVGNDYSFNEIFARQIEALANKGDLVIGISTSGNSKTVIKGILKAKEIGCYTVGLLGKDGGNLKDLVDLAIVPYFNWSYSI